MSTAVFVLIVQRLESPTVAATSAAVMPIASRVCAHARGNLFNGIRHDDAPFPQMRYNFYNYSTEIATMQRLGKRNTGILQGMTAKRGIDRSQRKAFGSFSGCKPPYNRENRMHSIFYASSQSNDEMECKNAWMSRCTRAKAQACASRYLPAYRGCD